MVKYDYAVYINRECLSVMLKLDAYIITISSLTQQVSMIMCA